MIRIKTEHQNGRCVTHMVTQVICGGQHALLFFPGLSAQAFQIPARC
jgi:hypothetical protein